MRPYWTGMAWSNRAVLPWACRLYVGLGAARAWACWAVVGFGGGISALTNAMPTIVETALTAIAAKLPVANVAPIWPAIHVPA